MTGFYGDDDEQSAEIVVKGCTISARADIGFRWNQDSAVFDAIYDEYETSPRLGENFFTHKLMQAYGKRMVKAKAIELQEKFGDCTISEKRRGKCRPYA